MTHERKMTATTVDGRTASMTLRDDGQDVSVIFEAERFPIVPSEPKVTRREMEEALAALRAEIPGMIAEHLRAQPPIEIAISDEMLKALTARADEGMGANAARIALNMGKLPKRRK